METNEDLVFYFKLEHSTLDKLFKSSQCGYHQNLFCKNFYYQNYLNKAFIIMYLH